MWIDIDRGPHLPPIACRDLGTGTVPLIHLHGGWGHDIYPLDRPLELLAPRYRVLIPDRVGYGRSGRRREELPLDFHRRAAEETLGVMDALAIDRAVLWGHSDGACIAVWMGLAAPDRCPALILEALHFDRAKPRSREFFETMAASPHDLGARVAAVLAAEHGESYWPTLLRLGGKAWRAIQGTPGPHSDLFDGRLGELTAPTLILHGAHDPRTEPGEMAAVRAALSRAEVHILEKGGHCPHSESATWRESTQAAVAFLNSLDL